MQNTPKFDREQLIYLSKLAEQCERYDGKHSFLSLNYLLEMVDYTKQFCKIGSNELSLDERNILSVAYKNIIATRRAAWRVLSSIQKKENNKGFTENVAKVKQYKDTIEKEMTNVCQEVLELLTDFLIPNTQSGEGNVFFYKMKADYNRYIAEYAVGDKKNKAAQ